MSLPENIIIAGQYTWISPEGEYFLLGLNDYLLMDYGEIFSVELPEVGEELDSEGNFVTVETQKGLVEIYSPISGQVVEINDELYDNPEILNYDPFGSGWLALISPDDTGAYDTFEGNGE